MNSIPEEIQEKPSGEDELSPPSKSEVTTSSKKAKKRSKKTTRKNANNVESRKTRTVRPFPAAAFEDSLTIALAIQQLGGDSRVRRITIFEHLKKSPDSGPSRQMITNSSAYGLTSGGYQADYLELTDDGMAATDPEAEIGDQFQSRLKLAVQGCEYFRQLYEKYAGSKLPATVVLRDYLRELGVEDEWLDECVSVFIVNCKFVGVLRDVAGAERLLKSDHALEEALKSKGVKDESRLIFPHVSGGATLDWEKKCFYITPIGEEGSEERRAKACRSLHGQFDSACGRTFRLRSCSSGSTRGAGYDRDPDFPASATLSTCNCGYVPPESECIL